MGVMMTIMTIADSCVDDNRGFISLATIFGHLENGRSTHMIDHRTAKR